METDPNPEDRSMRMTKRTVAAYGALGCAGVFAAYYLRHAAPILEHIEKHGVIGFVMGALALAIVAGIAAAWATSVGATNLKQAISAGLAVPAIVFAAGIDGGGKPPPETKSAGFLLLAGAGDDGGAFLDSLRLFFAPVESRVRAEREKADREVVKLAGSKLELEARLNDVNRQLTLATNDRIESAKAVAEARASNDAMKAKLDVALETARNLERSIAPMRTEWPALVKARAELGAQVTDLRTKLGAAQAREVEARAAAGAANASIEELKRTIDDLKSKSLRDRAGDVAVPDLRRLSLVDAYLALRRDGLVLGLSREFLVRPAEWLNVHVVGHRPEPGAKVVRGSAIEVEVR